MHGSTRSKDGLSFYCGVYIAFILAFVLDLSLQATTVASNIRETTTATTLAANEDFTAKPTTPQTTSADLTAAVANTSSQVQYTMTATFDLVFSSAYNDPQSDEYKNLTAEFRIIGEACFRHLGYNNFTIDQPVFTSGSVIARAMTEIVGVEDVEVLDQQIKDVVKNNSIPEVNRSNLVALEIIEEDQALVTTALPTFSNTTSQEETTTASDEEIITPQPIVGDQNVTDDSVATSTSKIFPPDEVTGLLNLIDTTTQSGSSSVNANFLSYLFQLSLSLLLIFCFTIYQ